MMRWFVLCDPLHRLVGISGERYLSGKGCQPCSKISDSLNKSVLTILCERLLKVNTPDKGCEAVKMQGHR